MLDPGLSMAGLRETASATLLFAGTALVLALVVAVVLGVLDELLLRRWVHMRALRWWLERIVPSEGNDSRNAPAELAKRRDELRRAFEVPMMTEPASEALPDPREKQEGDPRTEAVFWQLVTPVSGLTSRQLMGILSSSVQAELGNRYPSPFVCWLAALGSMPIKPSPFQALKPSNDTAADPDNSAARGALQAYAERALDGLQVQLLRARTIFRHTFAAVLVVWMVMLLAAQANSEAQVREQDAAVKLAAQTAAREQATMAVRAAASAPVSASSQFDAARATSLLGALTEEEKARKDQVAAYKVHRQLSMLLYVALSIVATAFVSVLSAPLDRLTATRAG
ncbi:hypothetical protein [Roseateles asaccharophilus]|uniref:Uncharacterized protein n=1 Tax=Roseateles asaccharophilus TaxID=582607 RepID=A0ABU2ACC9_9BURK|nr:hypothetical protein [Roseateles asaccharophilus]MDR7334864.1 hypothetical protein [Roseateles asaccharophilus]